MFHLDFPIPESSSKINLKDKVVLIGSCFADNFGEKLADHKFSVLSNPFGTIYNPQSISEILGDQIDNSAIAESQGVFYHWQAHSKISGLSQDELIVSIDQNRTVLQKELKEANWLVITLGSSFAYRLNESGQVVANCHKVPQREFKKVLLEVDEMLKVMQDALDKLKRRNSELQVLMTVSPVRHFRDGLVDNNRSKARLIEVVNELSWKNDWIKYFPAYEIQIDELRDYRFYANDRVHPNAEAIDYIWQRFQETYFDKPTLEFIKAWVQVKGAMNHRPIHPKSTEHQKFIKKTIERLEGLSVQVDVMEEIAFLQTQLL